jgi:hypothetical protein
MFATKRGKINYPLFLFKPCKYVALVKKYLVQR